MALFKVKKPIVVSALCLGLIGMLHAELAFPTAEGYGKYATGGRGGKVYEVTTLNSSGAGSLAEALGASGPRIVVFRVGGTIKGDFSISNGDITVAGQTAPGDGIAIHGTLKMNANNIILRYFRVRGNGSGDVIGGGFYFKNIIIDHISTSYSSDEVFSIYWNYDMTIQWCMITEACSANHKFGGIWGSERGSFHHNLFAHNTDRNPRISSGSGHNDVRNNVIYNWKNESIYGGERIQTNDNKKTSGDGCWVNVIGNYLKPGPGTPKAIEQHGRICSPWTQRGGAANYGKWYVADNVIEGHDDITKDNWKGVFPRDVAGGKLNDQASIPGLKLDKLVDLMPIKHQTAEEAYRDVLAGAGCSLPARDAVDKRIIEEVRTGTAAKGDNGFVSSVSQSDGHPVLKGGTAPTDTDHDGMPDDWEKTKKLDPTDPSDGSKKTLSTEGYTNVEMYINELAGDFLATSVRYSEKTPVKTDAISQYILSRKSLRIQANTANELNVSAFSMNGKELFSGTYSVGSGTNFIEIPLNSLKPGMYLFKYESDTTIKTERLNVL